MKTQDQRKKMTMVSGGVAEDVSGGRSGFESRLAKIGEFAKGIATEEDRGILEGILQSRQAQEFLTSMGGVSIPKSRAIRKARPIKGAKPPRMD
tara:strand:+ start:6645 stop:6926 length:282 start_codon:yes stop_codon:yes gene_type:complete